MGDRVSSSLTGRTKKKNQVNRLGFFYATKWDFVGHRPTHLWCRTHTTCIVTLRFLSKLNRYAITDTLCIEKMRFLCYNKLNDK